MPGGAGPTYVLDKTFYSVGSIGTYIAVRLGTPSTTQNYVSKLEGTVLASGAQGSILPIGITQTGCSASGKAVSVRMLGISKMFMRAVQGTLIQGAAIRVATHGKGMVQGNKLGTAPVGCVGYGVSAEGKGSANALIDVFVMPHIARSKTA